MKNAKELLALPSETVVEDKYIGGVFTIAELAPIVVATLQQSIDLANELAERFEIKE